MEYSVILSRYKLHFVRVQDKLVQDPSNNKSIVENQRIKAINISNYVQNLGIVRQYVAFFH